jgi:hypothetical protein
VGTHSDPRGLLDVKLDRFRMLEGKRPESSEPRPTAPELSERFAAVAQAPLTPTTDEAGLELEPRDRYPERAMIRCAECGHDNHPHVRACATCNTPLETRAVHQLNLRLQQEARVAEAAVRAHAPPRSGGAQDPATLERRSALDRVADRIPFAWPLRARRAAVVVGVAGALAVIYLATGWGIVGLMLAFVVTLGVFVIPM